MTYEPRTMVAVAAALRPQPDRAVAQEFGVRITADLQAWGARPDELAPSHPAT